MKWLLKVLPLNESASHLSLYTNYICLNMLGAILNQPLIYPAQLNDISQQYLWINPWQERDLSVEPQSTNLPIFKIARLVPEPTKLGYHSMENKLKSGWCAASYQNSSRLVPEFGGLGYFTKYPSPPSSGTSLGILRRNWWLSPLFTLFIQIGTRAHQARVPIWVFFEKRLMNQPLFKEYISCT